MQSNSVLLWPLLGGVIAGAVLPMKAIFWIVGAVWASCFIGIIASSLLSASEMTMLFGVAAMGLPIYGAPVIVGGLVSAALRKLRSKLKSKD